MLLKLSTALLLFSGTLYALDKVTDRDRGSSFSEVRVGRHGERIAERVAERVAAHATRVAGHDDSEADADTVIERIFAVQPGKLLDVDLKTGGSIRVSGWDEEEVQARAFLRGDDCDAYRLALEETEAGVEIGSRVREARRHTECSLRFEVKVPRRFDLSVETMGGDVRVSDVEGDIRGKTMGGGLDLTGLKGRLQLTTMGGEVSLTKSDVDGEVKTMGGGIRLEDVVGDVKGSTMGGNVSYTRVSKRGKSTSGDDLVRISTMGGDINVDEAPGGADVHTMGGSIRIRAAAGRVKAKTMGGNIDIDAVDGGVQATTMKGDVNVTMVGDVRSGHRDVLLKSSGGDVTLIVPEELSMNVDISLAYTRDHRGQYEIASDFPLQQRETSEWDRSDGSPRRYMYGTGSIGGGRNTLRIETVNGNVYLRKAGRSP